MSTKDSLAVLVESILSKNPDQTERALQAVNEGNYPSDDILNALTTGIEKARQMLHEGVFSIPDFLLAIDAYRVGVEFLKTYSSVSNPQPVKQEKSQVVIGVVDGDVHDMGKNIVAAVLEASGYHVHDVGKNTPNEVFLEKLMQTKPDVLALSTMMSTPIDNMAELIRMVKKMFPKTAILVGGAPFDAPLASRIGADGYAENATLVPEETRRILGS